nr:TetR/AcrR family transcriptional regulator [Gordonia humi]
MNAAAEMFGRRGWKGFTIEAVAKSAGVGKASIYLRWPNAEALLIDALATLGHLTDIDSGHVRTDLILLAEQVHDSFLGPVGQASRRLAVEADEIPAVRERWLAARDEQVSIARTLVRRAVDRGELPPSTSVTLLLDLLVGATTMHLQATPAHLLADSRESSSAYIRRVVDFLLDALTA